MKAFRLLCFLTFATGLQAVLFPASVPAETASETVDLLMNIETFDKWTNGANILLPFETYHPQCIVKIGDSFFLSAIDGDRAGYIIKFDLTSPRAGPARNSHDISRKTATLIRQVQLADPSFRNR